MNPTLQGLNEKQREAVISDEKRLLVLAGAGSGKTKTIIQKIMYLVFEKNVNPSEILAITFTRNAANEMLDRLIIGADEKGEYKKIIFDKRKTNKEKYDERKKYVAKYPWLSNLTVRTFHSLCFYILRNNGAKEFDNRFKILPDKEYGDTLGSYFQAPEGSKDILHKLLLACANDSTYLLFLKRYILDHYVEELRLKINKNSPNQYPRPYITLRGESVRSKSERYIADWLYRHNLDYEYEPPLQISNYQMNPDFYIPEANLYLEHVSNISSPMALKEIDFQEAGKAYFKTYESMTTDINEFHKELEKIIIPRIHKDISKLPALKFEEEFSGYHKELDRFITELTSVIDKIKVEGKNFQDIIMRSQKDPHKRVKEFYLLIEPIIKSYSNYCTYHSYLDYNDLIIKTIDLLNNYPDVKNFFQKKYKYILVDEFQDVNTLQVLLLKLLLTNETQLFCVGDDWQSIYGWRGSEVEYIVNFEKYFENPKIVKLDINYRSHDSIVSASSELIKHNKFQIAKEIHSISKKGKKIYLFASKKESEDGVEKVLEKIKQLLENGYTREDILILYRRTRSFEPYKSELAKANIKISSGTIHSAKGLEARIVFLVGLTSGIYGFPSIWEEDRIFQVIKETNYELRMEEERRLFYVAMTRAKEELFLITEIGNESSFLNEIPGDFLDRSNFLILNIINNENSLICSDCNNRIEESFLFCPYCGKTLLNGNNDGYIGREEINHVKLEDLTQKKSYQDRMDKLRKKYPRAYEKWESKEEDNLIKLFNQGTPISDIAKILERQNSAIRARLKKLGLIDEY